MSNDPNRKQIIQPIPQTATDESDDIEALRAHLGWLGEDLTRDDLLEAAAARALFDIHYSERWFNDAATSACSGDLLGEICEALGYEHEWVIGRPFDETWRVLSERVDQGLPTIVGGMMPADLPGTSRCAEYHLFVGYESANGDATAALCGNGGDPPIVWTRLPEAHGRPNSWQARVRCLAMAPQVWAGRPMFIVGPRRQPSRLGTRGLALANLQRAASAARCSEGPTGRWQLWGGLSALAKWADDIEHYPEAIERKPERERGFPLTSITRSLCDELHARRRRAARYLRDIRHLFSRDAKVALCDAAVHCDTIARLILDFRETIFGVARGDAEEDLGRRNLLRRPVRLSAAVLLRQVVVEEEAMTSCLEEVVATEG